MGCLPIKCLTIRGAFVIEAGLVLRLASQTAAVEVPASALAGELEPAGNEPKQGNGSAMCNNSLMH